LIFGSRLQAPHAIAMEATVHDWQRNAATTSPLRTEMVPTESGLIS
jgi:hypothetical protein